jgi:hypothetical protein
MIVSGGGVYILLFLILLCETDEGGIPFRGRQNQNRT